MSPLTLGASWIRCVSVFNALNVNKNAFDVNVVPFSLSVAPFLRKWRKLDKSSVVGKDKDNFIF